MCCLWFQHLVSNEEDDAYLDMFADVTVLNLVCYAKSSRVYQVCHKTRELEPQRVIVKNDYTIECSCGLLVRLGIICRHIFTVFTNRSSGMILSPCALYHPRWITKKKYRTFSVGDQSGISFYNDDKPITNLWKQPETPVFDSASPSRVDKVANIYGIMRAAADVAADNINVRQEIDKFLSQKITDSKRCQSIKSPRRSKTKGRPKTKRIKSAIERSRKKAKT